MKEKLDITIEEETIIKINKLKYKSDNNKPLKYNKFVIRLNNSNIKSSILKNKNQLKDTNIYIQEFLDNSTNIFFNTRKLRSENNIINTWIYNNNIFIETNDNKKIQIINVIRLNNSNIKSSILKNKNQLKDTNIYIQEFLDNSTNIFFNTRKLRSENNIINTWIYNNNIFIETNDNKKIQIINQLHLENIIDNISL